MTIWLNDTFTDTAGVLLTAHTSDSTGTWTACTSGASGSLAPKINALYNSSVTPSAAGTGTYVQATASNVADSYIGVDVTWDGTAFTAFGIAARYNAAGTTGYLLTYDNGNTSLPVWKFLRNDSGTMTLLASATANGPATLSSGTVCRISFMVVGSGSSVTLTMKLNNFPVFTFSDTSASRVVTAGLAGLNFNVPAAGAIYFGSIVGADNEVQIQVKTPTPSTSSFKVVRVGTGLDYANLSAFASYAGSFDHVANAQILCAEVYEDQDMTSLQILPKNVNDQYYCLIRPVPGYSVNDIDKAGAFAYTAAGITVTIATKSSYNYAYYGNGLRMTGFKIHVTGTLTTDTCAAAFTKYGQTGGNSSIQDWKLNRILVDSVAPNVIQIGDSYGVGHIDDNLVVFSASGSGAVATNQGYQNSSTFDRNTVVRLGAAAPALNGWFGGSVQDNVFSGNAQAAITGNITGATIAGNVSNASADSGVAGFTYTTSTLFQSATSDFRPLGGGPLIGTANSAAVSKNDIRGNNRGTSPDVGCVQLNPATALPTGTITNQPAPSGQNLTIPFATTGAPTSSIASLDPDSANPNGAVQIFATVTLGTNTGSASWTGIQPGNYIPTITVTNAGGTASVSGTVPVSILGISGTPTASPTGTGASATAVTISGPSSGVLSTPVTFTIGTDSVLTGSQTETVTVSDNASGTFSPVNVTLTATTTTANVTYTPNGALGNRVVSAAASGTPTLISASLTFNATAPATVVDTTLPVMAGSIVIGTITNSSIAFSYPAASDNVGVVGYEVSMNGGASYTAIGNVLNTNQTGLAAGTAYRIAVRAFDAAANKALPLTATATTLATAPTPVQRLVTVTLVDSQGAPRSNLTGIKWAFFETTTPDLWAVPVSQGSGATTNALGVMSVSVLTVLPSGATGSVVFTDATGSATQFPPPKAVVAAVSVS